MEIGVAPERPKARKDNFFWAGLDRGVGMRAVHLYFKPKTTELYYQNFVFVHAWRVSTGGLENSTSVQDPWRRVGGASMGAGRPGEATLELGPGGVVSFW